MRCPACGAEPAATRRAVSELPLERCLRCGSEFLWPQPDEATSAAIYGQGYFDSWGLGDGEAQARRLKRATFRLRLALVADRLPRGARILDVGCATGFFLEEAAAQGFEPYGVEISEYGASICRERFGPGRIFHGRLEAATFADNPERLFEAVFLSDVLEHARDPGSLLAAVHAALVNRGVLVVTTPRADSMSRRLLGARWPHLKHEHLVYFSRRGLEGTLRRSGFARTRHARGYANE